MILKLTLKKKWFDMILSGEKKEEYRATSLYWKRRFNNMYHSFGRTKPFMIKIKNKLYDPEDIIICFSNGYAKDRRQFKIECKNLLVDYGSQEWGAERYKQYFVLSLGKIL